MNIQTNIRSLFFKVTSFGFRVPQDTFGKHCLRAKFPLSIHVYYGSYTVAFDFQEDIYLKSLFKANKPYFSLI